MVFVDLHCPNMRLKDWLKNITSLTARYLSFKELKNGNTN